MYKSRRSGQTPLSRGEQLRGWIFFALYLFFFPWLMGWVQRFYPAEFPVAEANVVYYFISVFLVFLLFWRFLQRNFVLLLDRLP